MPARKGPEKAAVNRRGFCAGSQSLEGLRFLYAPAVPGLVPGFLPGRRRSVGLGEAGGARPCGPQVWRGPEGPEGVHLEGAVFLGEGVTLPSHATIIGPVWIGAGTQIRPGAFIRGNVITGEGCVLGNSSEFKNCLLMDGVQAPHFNYVGDSVLGNKAHLGAGAICSNLRLDQNKVI